MTRATERFPPWETVYYWFRRLMRRFLFKTLHDLVLLLDRMMAEREAFVWRCQSMRIVD